MRILVLSFYFAPDLSAGSFRTTAVVRELKRQLPTDSHIDVLTTMPNRYSSFNAQVPETEEESRLSIHRVRLPPHRSGMIDQSRAFLAYARAVRTRIHHCNYDLIFATSSRLMTAVLGARLARSQKLPLYLDIRDIFVDTIADILPKWVAWPLSGAFSLLESYTIKSASKVNLVSGGFEEYFNRRYPWQRFSFFPNGIDDEFLTYVDKVDEHKPTHPYNILYAGNIGEGQGLHLIIPDLASALNEQANFTIIGDGGRKEQLQRALDAADARNVILRDPVDRQTLIHEYKNADVLFLHLNDYPAFRKVLPSKIFEYAATGKPILAGVAGYAKAFIDKEIENAQIFPPCQPELALTAFSDLQLQQTPRFCFVSKFSRSTLVNALAQDILECRSQ